MTLISDASQRVEKSNTRMVIANGLLVGSLFALFGLAILSLAIGATGTSLTALPGAIYYAVFGEGDTAAARNALILLDIRLPRTLLAGFVGASLAVAGALMQGLFRNPLAEPGLIGVSSGAALGAITLIAFGNEFAAPWVNSFGVFAIPFAAFFGGIITTSILALVANRGGQLMIGTLLLSGVALGAFAEALTGFISYLSDDRELRDLTLWRLGSLSGSSWPKVWSVLPFAIVALVVVPNLRRALNGFLLGEAQAFHMGIDVERTKFVIIGISAACVGAAVAVAGVIGFVGLVVPHVVRLITGPDHNTVIPVSALLGASLVIVADIIARVAVQPAELPIGIITAVLGAPVLLHLVLRRGKMGVG